MKVNLPILLFLKDYSGHVLHRISWWGRFRGTDLQGKWPPFYKAAWNIWMTAKDFQFGVADPLDEPGEPNV